MRKAALLLVLVSTAAAAQTPPPPAPTKPRLRTAPPAGIAAFTGKGTAPAPRLPARKEPPRVAPLPASVTEELRRAVAEGLGVAPESLPTTTTTRSLQEAGGTIQL